MVPLQVEGDGNGVIEGISANSAASNNGFLQSGETTSFWVDLSIGNAAAPININLVEGSFNTATPITFPAIASTALANNFPAAKLGRGNYFYVYSTGGLNYYGMSNVSSVAGGGVITSTTSITTSQAFQIE